MTNEPTGKMCDRFLLNFEIKLPSCGDVCSNGILIHAAIEGLKDEIQCLHAGYGSSALWRHDD